MKKLVFLLAVATATILSSCKKENAITPKTPIVDTIKPIDTVAPAIDSVTVDFKTSNYRLSFTTGGSVVNASVSYDIIVGITNYTQKDIYFEYPSYQDFHIDQKPDTTHILITPISVESISGAIKIDHTKFKIEAGTTVTMSYKSVVYTSLPDPQYYRSVLAGFHYSFNDDGIYGYAGKLNEACVTDWVNP